MDIYLLFIIISSLLGIQFYIKSFNKDYLSKKNSSCIKGIFILIVFYSHFLIYIDSNNYSYSLMYNLRNFLGQLMVTMFLFYSGFGVFESIKAKKNNYISSMPKKRILKTWINFIIAVFSFILLNIILSIKYSIIKLLLSFIGWESLGNSNWYIFSIIFMYILTYFSFKIFDKSFKNALFLNIAFVVIFILFMSKFKDDYWFNTIMCYPFGMIYSFNKKKIEKVLFDNKKYLLILLMSIFSFIVFNIYSNSSFWYYELYSISFCFLIILFSLKISFNSLILKWFGDNLFWVYILQRIPMILFQKLGLSIYPYKYLLITFVSTVVLVFLYNYLFKNAINLILNKTKK